MLSSAFVERVGEGQIADPLAEPGRSLFNFFGKLLSGGELDVTQMKKGLSLIVSKGAPQLIWLINDTERNQ